MAQCARARFSEETIEKLRADPYETTRLSQPCAECGRRVVAVCTGGVWYPEAHSKPVKYDAGESKGRGKSEGRGKR